jgi:hypothetical protein
MFYEIYESHGLNFHADFKKLQEKGDINEALWIWFQRMRSINLQISCSMIQATEIQFIP